MRVTLRDHNAERLLRGVEGNATGRIVEGLREAGVNNPVFIFEAVDRVEQEAAEALLGVLDPVRRTAFRDACVDVAFDLSAVLWIVTATDPGAIPEPVRKHLAVVELPGYTEQEKLAIAERHLLTRPFDEPARAAGRVVGARVPSAARDERAGRRYGHDDRGGRTGALVGPGVGAVVGGRAAARRRRGVADGGVRQRRPLRDRGHPAGDPRPHPRSRRGRAEPEAGGDLQPRGVGPAAGGREPEVITEATVRQVLGDGAADALPPAVRAAIESERRRLSANADADAAPSNDWIEWLEHLPWNRRSGAPADLAQARAALDARHAGLDHAKARIVEGTWPCAAETGAVQAP